MTAWKTTPHADEYLPSLNAAEVEYGIPTDLLARQAYQESHFRDDIVDGTTCSRAACKGLMQLNPRFFPGAGISWRKDIITAAVEMARLGAHFDNWALALAAYNWGQGNLEAYIATHHKPDPATLPKETRDYVRQITADVPLGDLPLGL